MESISNSGSAIGILAKDGIILATEKKVISKLLDTGAVGCKREKMYKIDSHLAVAVAGLTADANIPPTLLTTSTRDDRVHPGHARKVRVRVRRAP